MTPSVKLTIGIQKTTDLAQPFVDFPINSSDIEPVVNSDGQLEIEFSVPDEAAFFQIQVSIGVCGP